MTHFWTRTAVLAVIAAALTACQTTPTYPTREGYVPPPPPEPLRPVYSATREAAPGAAVQAGDPLPPVTSASPRSAVESSELPPPDASPPTPAMAEPAPPVYVPPPPPVEARNDPPPRAEPPPRPRPVPTRLVATGRTVTIDGGMRNYTVQSGDHVDALAREHDTTRRQIVQDNDLEPPYRIHPGDTLRLPGPPRTAYVVVNGDTLAAIARRFSVRAEALRSINNLNARATLRSGQRLTLPGTIRDIGPQRIPAPDLVRAEAPRPPRPRPAPVETAQNVPPPPVIVARNDPPPRPPVIAAPPPPALIPYTRVAPPAAAPRPAPALAAPPAVRGAPPVVASSPPVGDAQIAAMGRGRFQWPVVGSILSTFGPKSGGRRNDGIDIQGLDGASVRAAAAGEVVYAGDQVPGFGNLVLVKHADGWVTAYAHLGRVNVSMRQRVTQGQEIGTVGTSGGASEPQLHFEVRFAPTPADRARPIDPALVLPAPR